MKKVAIVGYGKVGRAYHKVFPDALIYDPYVDETIFAEDVYQGNGVGAGVSYKPSDVPKAHVNKCDVALVAVFTAHKPDGSLDMSIVEEVVGWIECPLIIIKSALQPMTTERLVEKTGKRIAVSVEYVGEGNYPVHFWKYPHQNDPRYHQMLVIGGEEDVAEEAGQFLWRYLSPDIKIHKVTATEAEIVKLIENTYPAFKVTFMNAFNTIASKSGQSFIRMHQAWNSDPRTDSMHIRAVDFDRGWASKCWDKDIPALRAFAKDVGATDMVKLIDTVLEVNKDHLSENKK